MSSHQQVEVVTDVVRNLLNISFFGDIGVSEIQHYENEVADALKAVQRGFTLLTDLTHLQSMDLLCVPTLEKTMDQFRTSGVSRIIRIIPDPGKDIGFSIMSLFHYPRSLHIITCESLAEAERALS